MNEDCIQGYEDLQVETLCMMCTSNCKLTAKFVDGKPYVSGSRCPRGDKYGVQKLKKAMEEGK